MVYVVYMGYSLFSTYLIWAYYSENVSFIVMLNNAVILTYMTYRLIAIANRISELMDEVGTLATQVHSAINLQANFEGSEVNILDFMYFSQLILHRKPVFNLYVFNLNWSTLNSIFGAIMSYLIILIQFDNPSLLHEIDANIIDSNNTRAQ